MQRGALEIVRPNGPSSYRPTSWTARISCALAGSHYCAVTLGEDRNSRVGWRLHHPTREASTMTAVAKAKHDDRPWLAYTRLSRKKPANRPTGRQRRDDDTTERQERDIRTYAAEQGLTISTVFCDPTRSAWKKKAAVRPEFLRMMAEAQTGNYAGVLVWKLDRFSRAPRDAEDFIELAEKHGVLFDGPHSGRYDLNTPKGRAEFRAAAARAAEESDTISLRSSLGIKAAMEEGWPVGGGRRFGFARAGDVEHNETEAAVVREMARRVLEGETLQNLAAELTRRGLVTAVGGKFTGANLGRLLSYGRYGGWVELKGERVARMAGEPILDEDTFDAVTAMLSSRRRGRRPSGRFLMTGLLVCGQCGHTMNGLNSSKLRADGTSPRRYVCPPQLGGCNLSILADAVDNKVRDRVLSDLADPDILSNIAKRNDNLTESRAAAAKAVHDLDEQLADLEVKKQTREIRPLAYERSKPVLDKLIATAEAALAELDSPVAAVNLVSVDEGDWTAASNDERRSMIRRLGLSVTIAPMKAGAPRNVFLPERIVIPQ